MKHPLDNVEGNYRFWVHKGPIVSSLKELLGVLKNMSDESFNHHVNKDKNDFSSWINDIFGEAKLAKDIRTIKTKAAIAKKIQLRINALKKKP